MEIYLRARQPFSLPSVIRSHGWVRLAPFRYEDHSDGFNYVIRLDTGLVVDVHIQEMDNGVQLRVDSSLATAERDSIYRAASWMPGLGEDFSAFFGSGGGEPK